MAEYQENQIVLSEEESETFRQRMERPNKETLRRSDLTLEWICPAYENPGDGDRIRCYGFGQLSTAPLAI